MCHFSVFILMDLISLAVTILNGLTPADSGHGQMSQDPGTEQSLQSNCLSKKRVVGEGENCSWGLLDTCNLEKSEFHGHNNGVVSGFTKMH